jgi:hypothetical protein
LGVAIRAFALWRLGWRLIEGFPVELSHAAAWQEPIAGFTHWFLLLGTLFMPASGVMMSLRSSLSNDVLGLFTIPAIVLHVAGTLKHQIFDKDGTLARMTGRRVSDRAQRAYRPERRLSSPRRIGMPSIVRNSRSALSGPREEIFTPPSLPISIARNSLALTP